MAISLACPAEVLRYKRLHCAVLPYLRKEALESESAALAVPSHPVDDVHAAKNQSSEPRKREEHDGAASQRPTGDIK